ncbi:MAG TPA: glycosyltransferase [Bacillota bacterium]|nr:glycosyltransferase [Bacillota bacterium]
MHQSLVNQPLVSIILPCKNEGQNIVNTVNSMLSARGKYLREIIVVDDGSTDGCCDCLNPPPLGVRLVTTPGLGAAQARNVGGRLAQGQYLVFCDAHVFVGDYWLEHLLPPLFSGEFMGVCPGIAPVENPDMAGWGQTLKEDFGIKWLSKPHQVIPVPILPGGCLAVTREAFEYTGGFDDGFRVWGHEDVEFSLHLWLCGFPLAVNPAVLVLHVFRPSHPYPVTFNHYYYNILRLAHCHLSPARQEKIADLARKSPEFPELHRQMLENGAPARREQCHLKRRFDDDWLFNGFGIEF